ncbi:MAG: sensor domain-containing diguanylate cyclase [Xanthomonadales bacterium]|nr:sensor domain-containing diguanylate cyclase [Xanthomonadales bacterium]
MTATGAPALDKFPAGFLVTDAERNITYANRYFETRFGFDPDALRGRNLLDLLSRASAIMCESYVFPLLLHERHCEEIQLVMLDAAGDEVPVIINAVSEEDKRIYWSVYSSTRRDRLYQDLVEARRTLEEKAAALKVLSATDELTGLLNRRELLRQSQSIIAGANRNQRPISVLVLDIDNFKQINDRWGHAVGDKVLEDLGRLLREHGRASDITARFGGDEFVCLLPDTDTDAARVFADRLHQIVRQVDSAGFKLTISIGLATETGDISFEGLFRKADKALYESKSTGRNKSSISPGGNDESGTNARSS